MVVARHTAVATLPDDPGYEIGTNEWNADHNIEQSGAAILGKLTAGVGTTIELTGAEVLTFAGGEVAGTSATGIANHEAAANPHPGYLTPAEGDAAYPPLAHTHTGAGEALVPEAGLDILNAPADRYILSYDGTTSKMEWITTTIYPATSVSLITGTLNAGTITSFATRNDADIYDIQEVTGVPGIDIRVSFANVAAFNTLRFQVDHVCGTGTHKVEYALWNVGLAQWDLLTSLRTTNGYVEVEVTADNYADYIDTGASNTVICRMYHPITGAGTHRHYWEYMVLVDSIAGGGGISEHQALSGLDVAGSHPATAISSIPSGSLIATDIQAAVNELDSETSTHYANVANPHSTTKTQVGLGNVTDDAQLKRAAGDFSTFTNKATPVGADVLLIEDSAAAGVKKNIALSTLLGASSGYSTFEEEGVAVTQRATANFVGSGVTVTDNGTKTIVTISGAAGSTDIRAATVTAAYGVFEHEETVTDGDVTAASNIILSWGSTTSDDENGPDMDDIKFSNEAGTGSFIAKLYSENAFGGPVKLHYLIG